MHTHRDKIPKSKSNAVAHNLSGQGSKSGSVLLFTDNRPEAILQRKLQDLITHNSHQHAKAFESTENSSVQAAIPFGIAGNIPNGCVVQPFWLRDKSGSIAWVNDNKQDLTKYQKTSAKKWKYKLLPGFMNEELPVYEEKPKKPNKSKLKSLNKGSSSSAKVELSAEEWLSGVQYEIRDWVEERGGMVNKPEDWEFKALWETRPKGYSGDWDSWQDLRQYYRKESGVTKEEEVKMPSYNPRSAGKVKTPKPEAEIVDEYVDQVMQGIERAIGRYPLWTKKENPARADCVKFGPDTQVPVQYAEKIYQEFIQKEGAPFRGGKLHVVHKGSSRNYNVTLHGSYKNDNPKTMVNMHVSAA